MIALSEGAWGAVVAIIANLAMLAALFVRQGRQSASVEQINRAVNHQAVDKPTLIDRVITLEVKTDNFIEETEHVRKWEHGALRSIASHIGLTLPHRNDQNDYGEVA